MYPIINRGTWARVFSIKQVLHRFINAYLPSSKAINIINLGAGLDTTFFTLVDEFKDQGLLEKLTYVEVDFEDVVHSKIQVIKKHEALLKYLAGNDEEAKEV